MSDRITFAIDYDRTYSRAPELFNKIIALIKADGHRVFIVTARCGNGHDSVCLENQKELAEATAGSGCKVVFTDLAAKDWHMVRKLGIKVDIWIDDTMHAVTNTK